MKIIRITLDTSIVQLFNVVFDNVKTVGYGTAREFKTYFAVWYVF